MAAPLLADSEGQDNNATFIPSRSRRAGTGDQVRIYVLGTCWELMRVPQCLRESFKRA